MKRKTCFRHGLLLIVAITQCYICMSQSIPDWYDEGSRKQHYPESVYYTGMAYANVTSSEGDAVSNAEQAAKTEALSKILVSVNSRTMASTVSTTVTTAGGLDEHYTELFSSHTNIDVVFKDIPNLQCQHYRNGATVMAFAYAKKVDLARYYDRKITSLLVKIETILDNADELVGRGEKIKARSTAQTALQYLADLDNAQRVLLAVSNEADIQSTAASTLTKRLVAILAELKNSTAIYLDCKVFAHNDKYVLFNNDLKGILSNLGCNFVNNKAQADWVLSVEADIVRENSANNAYFVWVDGAVAVRNNTTAQVIYNNKISSITDKYPMGIKGGHTAGYGQATAAAYKEAAKIIGNKIVEIINQ